MTASESGETSPNELTLILPLRKKNSLDLEDFYDYWLNVHVTMPPRFPGIHDVWLHTVSFDHQTWPRIAGVSHRPPEEDEFHGVPEATFQDMAGLAAFQHASGLQMDDGLNFLAEQIAYRSVGANTATLVDHCEPAPDGTDGAVRHLLFLRRRADVPVADFRAFVKDMLAPAYSGTNDVMKVRRHLFEEVELTLDHPGVAMFKPVERQYQAAIEIVMQDADQLERFSRSSAWTDTADEVRAHCEAVHAARVDRCITTKYQGQITLAGVRGIRAADAITRLHADNQREAAVMAMFLPTPA